MQFMWLIDKRKDTTRTSFYNKNYVSVTYRLSIRGNTPTWKPREPHPSLRGLWFQSAFGADPETIWIMRHLSNRNDARPIATRHVSRRVSYVSAHEERNMINSLDIFLP